METAAIPDFYGIDALLTEEERAFRQTLSGFVGQDGTGVSAFF